MTDYLQKAELAEKRAREIADDLKIAEIWRETGAEINIVGSLRIGVLGKHRDIDFHVYTDELDVEKSFQIMAKICRNPNISACSFSNLAETEESCFEWHLQRNETDGNPWQIDIIQIKKGSRYEGYFEKTADAIKEAMTADMRRTILKLKFETPDDMKICGIEYYKAVIQNGISTFDAFLQWRRQQNFSGIIPW